MLNTSKLLRTDSLMLQMYFFYKLCVSLSHVYIHTDVFFLLKLKWATDYYLNYYLLLFRC